MAEGNGETALAPEFESFYAHAREKRTAFPRCRSCGRFHWYPMKRCPHCLAAELEWVPVAGRASLWAFTEVNYPFDAKMKDKLPYIVGLVEFPDAPGVRMITNVIDARFDDLQVGMPVEVVHEDTNRQHPKTFVRPAA